LHERKQLPCVFMDARHLAYGFLLMETKPNL
jgi:hypothetical protein